MILQLNPLLEALDTARRAAADVIHPNDEVTVDDQNDQWIFEFIPQGDSLGGGVRVYIAKSNLQVLKVVLGQ
jgi:hypothetical protein